MPKQVTLQIESIENDDLVVTSKTFVIRKAKFVQLTQLMSVITDVVKEVKGDADLKGLFNSFSRPVNESDKAAVEKAEMAILDKATAALPTLAVKLPNQVLEILSTLSRIDKKILEEQELADIFQVYNAVLEENNVEEIIETAKKSLELTKSKFNFKGLVERVNRKQ
ncbi:hypothetical protein [Bacillus weihaiensis]|uniref:hypothetical protein n=1 Tax=Bacillus weihaiensis TaxID=1547283 RepID=UPI002357F71A|nr:hypothetical protein [Bacillus weihaiensis]